MEYSERMPGKARADETGVLIDGRILGETARFDLFGRVGGVTSVSCRFCCGVAGGAQDCGSADLWSADPADKTPAVPNARKDMTRETYEFPYVFFSGGVEIAARLHRGVENLSEGQIGVVVSGSWLTVKEQMADCYARALARRGYTALTFDFAGFGESGGAPRQLELPDRKIGDMIAATRFLSTCAFVEPMIGYLAICASSQYALHAIARGAPIAAFASVAGWHHDAESVAAFYGGADGVARRIDRARKALDLYRRTGEMRMAPAYAEGDERAGMFFPIDYYGNPARGAVPAWRNEMAEMSWLYWLTFGGVSIADQVDIPSLIVHGDACALPENARRVHEKLERSELVWTEGAQQDFYDQPEFVEKAVAAVDAHFRRHLS
jgi:fermentation-respiration switch protein FrsA (DUF1100 family)